MKTSILATFIFIGLNLLGQTWSCGDTIVDLRDGQKYGSVQIGNLCWMSESLNFGEMLDSISMPSDNNIIENY